MNDIKKCEKCKEKSRGDSNMVFENKEREELAEKMARAILKMLNEKFTVAEAEEILLTVKMSLPHCAIVTYYGE